MLLKVVHRCHVLVKGSLAAYAGAVNMAYRKGNLAGIVGNPLALYIFLSAMKQILVRRW